MIFLTRRQDMSREAFADWWLGPHRVLAEKLPGLRRHAFNLLPDGAPYDAVVEQWFASVEDLSGAYATPAGQAVAADSAQHVASRHRTLVEEHTFAVTGNDA